MAHSARVLAREGLRSVPVTRGAALIGVLTDIDLAAAHPSAGTTLSVREIADCLEDVTVGRLLEAGTPAVGSRTPLADAIGLMRARRMTALPVVRGNELVGLLVEDDLLDLLSRQLEGEAH